MSDDRLDWIFDATTDSLESRYDAWAATYDDDHDQWGWRGPDMVAEAALRLTDALDDTHVILDAGCGTGKAGIALRSAGWCGRLVGVDLSQGMLEMAATTGIYDDLVRCSLEEIPMHDARVSAIVSSGVFTHGHVGGDAFSELCRITMPGGTVTVTQRIDLVDAFEAHVVALAEHGTWEEIERSEPELFHPERDDTEQMVLSWRVHHCPQLPNSPNPG